MKKQRIWSVDISLNESLVALKLFVLLSALNFIILMSNTIFMDTVMYKENWLQALALLQIFSLIWLAPSLPHGLKVLVDKFKIEVLGKKREYLYKTTKEKISDMSFNILIGISFMAMTGMVISMVAFNIKWHYSAINLYAHSTFFFYGAIVLFVATIIYYSIKSGMRRNFHIGIVLMLSMVFIFSYELSASQEREFAKYGIQCDRHNHGYTLEKGKYLNESLHKMISIQKDIAFEYGCANNKNTYFMLDDYVLKIDTSLNGMLHDFSAHKKKKTLIAKK